VQVYFYFLKDILFFETEHNKFKNLQYILIYNQYGKDHKIHIKNYRMIMLPYYKID